MQGLPKRLIQVAGTAALYLAAKMEEINPPKIHTLVEATDGGSTAAQLLAMEKQILLTLGYHLNPTTLDQELLSVISEWELLNQDTPGFGLDSHFIIKDRIGVNLIKSEVKAVVLQRQREIASVADFILLDGRHLSFDKRDLSLALVYLL